MKILLPKFLTIALLGLCLPFTAWSSEDIVQAQILAGMRSEAGLSWRHTTRWGIFGEMGGGLQWLFVTDENAPTEAVSDIWALAPRFEVGQQLVQRGSWGGEIYGGIMPWGYILDNTIGCCSSVANDNLHWEPWQGYAGLRATWKRLPATLWYWHLGAYGEIGYTRFRLTHDEYFEATDRVVSGSKLRMGLQAKWGGRLGSQPTERSLAWAITSITQDSSTYRASLVAAGISDPDPRVRRATLPLITHEGQLADFLIQEKDSTVRAAGIAQISDPQLRHYLEAFPPR